MKSVLVCINHRKNPSKPSCAGRGSLHVAQCLTQAINEKKLDIQIEKVQCLGACEEGPNIKLVPNGAFMHHVSDENISDVLTTIESFVISSSV